MDNQLVDDVVDNDDDDNNEITTNNKTSNIMQAQHIQQQQQQQQQQHHLQSLSTDNNNTTSSSINDKKQFEPNTSVVLSKKDRGRFKKLWKKSIHYDNIINCKSDISGLTNINDYIEFQSLLSLKVQQDYQQQLQIQVQGQQQSSSSKVTINTDNNTKSVPIIRLQWKFGKVGNIVVDGKDHRDILLQFIYYTTINNVNNNYNNHNHTHSYNKPFLLNEQSNKNHKNNLKRKHNQITTTTIGSCNETPKDNNVDRSLTSNDCTTTTTTTTTTNLQLPKWINNTIPSWISIHNPVVINHIAVIEIHINYKQQQDNDIIVESTIQNVNNQFRQLFGNLQHRPIHTSDTNNNNDNHHHNDKCANTNVLVTETKWYDGLTPKSISDVLMYSTASTQTQTQTTTKTSTVDARNTINDDNKTIDNKKLMQDDTNIKLRTKTKDDDDDDNDNINDDNKKNNNEHWSASRLYEKLYPLMSPYDQLKREGFPLSQHHQLEHQLPLPTTSRTGTTTGGVVVKDTFGTIPSLVCAVKYIQQYHVQPNELTITESNKTSQVDQRPKFVSPHVRTHGSNQQQQPLKESDENNDKYKYNIFALDCEMVKTEHASELARVTLVQLEFATVVVQQSIDNDYDNNNNKQNDQVLVPECATTTNGTNKIILQTKLIFDVLVKPYNTIIDYVTEYSGVTESMLSGIDVVRIEQVQVALLNTIHPNDIIIGHSLENDFLALRYIHTTIVDTSHIFRHSSNKFKYSLRHLSAILLKKHIRQGVGGQGQGQGQDGRQTTTTTSHCSKEDAITALELAIYRAIIGPTFTINNNKYNGNRQINRFGQLISNKETKAVCIGPITWLQQYFIKHNGSSNTNNEPSSAVGLASIHALQCETITDPNTKAIKAYLNCTNPKRNAQVLWSNFKTTVCTKEGQMSINDTNTYQQFFSTLLVLNNGKEQKSTNNYNNQQSSKLNNVLLPTNTIIAVAVQHDYDTVIELNKQRQIRRTNRSVTIPWTDTDEKNYTTVLQRNQNGLTFWIGPQV